jgi:hypothetical protein
MSRPVLDHPFGRPVGRDARPLLSETMRRPGEGEGEGDGAAQAPGREPATVALHRPCHEIDHVFSVARRAAWVMTP